MDQTITNFLDRRRRWFDHATDTIQKHAPLLNRQQAEAVAVIALKSWQDLRDIREWVEHDEFISTLR